jgi:hypothetical protein
VNGEVALGQPGNVGTFPVRLKLAAEEFVGEAERELLAHFSVVGGHDMVRVCGDPGQTVDLDVKSGLLPSFATSTLFDRLATLHPSAWQGPQRIVFALDQNDASLVITDDRSGRRENTVCLRGGQVFEVVDASHLVLPFA